MTGRLDNGGPPPAMLAAIGVAVIGALGIIALFALNLGPFASPSSPPPSPAATAAPSGLATAAPTSPAAGSPRPSSAATAVPASAAPTSTPATPQEALLRHVPEAIRPTCSVHAGDGQALLVADCSSPDGAITLSYSTLANTDLLEQAFSSLRLGAGIEPDSGSCADHATWPAEGVYSASGEPAGRFLCTDERGAPTIYWTDTALVVLAQASLPAGSTDPRQLVDFWLNEAGPAR